MINCINKNYGLNITRLTRLPWGADINAAAYKAEAQNGRTYFLKVKYGPHSDSTIELISLLKASGIEQVISPIRTVENKLTQLFENATLILYPFVERKNGFDQPLTDAQWITLGRVLRRIHEFKVPPAIKQQIRQENYSPQYHDAVRSLDTHLVQHSNGDETAKKTRALLKERKPIIDRLVERAEFLSEKVRKQSPEYVLCHSDIHAGNILIGDSLYIIDWDDPIMAPRERDLMFIGGGVANVWNQPREEALFYKGYGEITLNKDALAYYRHERIVVDIAEYAQALLFTNSGGADRINMYNQFLDQFAPGGVVDIAFKTDEGSNG